MFFVSCSYLTIILFNVQSSFNMYNFLLSSQRTHKKIEAIVEDCICNLLNEGIINWAQIKQTLVEVLSPFLYSKTGRRPILLPIIMEV
ncbi:hypothetical protein [Bacillus cereus]|uniref:hypothetical protein n=1 Tax=Bacillus cereus TaxID=1396 RepID=UPI0027DC0344|nr:hypothetical protein [Bacillus cereus]